MLSKSETGGICPDQEKEGSKSLVNGQWFQEWKNGSGQEWSVSGSVFYRRLKEINALCWEMP